MISNLKGEKVDILTKEANAKKKLESKPKKFRPVIQAVEAKMLGSFYKKLYFYKTFRPRIQPFLSTTS